MIRRPFAPLLPLALLLAGCTDRLLPTATPPEAPVFVQLPGSPVVNSLLDDDNDCREEKCTLRAAIAFASPGATITFSVTGIITLTQGELGIARDLTISGPGASTSSVSGNGASRVFVIGNGAAVTLSGLTITGGVGSGGRGGGISNEGTLTLQNSTVTGNEAWGSVGFGGGIYNEGTLTLQNSTVTGNQAGCCLHGVGGGIYNEGTVTLRNSTVSGNVVGGVSHRFGGGIYNGGTVMLIHSSVSGNTATLGGGITNEGTLTITHSTVSGNIASVLADIHGEGGGISNGSVGTLTLSHSTISNNSAMGEFSRGGGIFGRGTVTITHSTVSGNRAESSGGISNRGTMILAHSTVADNHGGRGGGGIDNEAGTLTLQNSIVANNTKDGSPGGDCWTWSPAALIDSGYNLVGDGSCISDETSHEGDPRLGPLADNGGPTHTHALLPGSPALDAIPFGSNGCGLSTDQRGLPRPAPSGGTCDIGAFEVQPVTLTLGIDANGTLTKKTGAATLSGTLTCSSAVTVTVNANLSQTQTKGKTTTTVSGSGSTSVSCTGNTAWTVTVTAESGKFAAGAADATAEAGGASAGQTVQLK